MTESQWSFKKTQWDNYINQSVVSDSVKLMQLQAACEDSLRQRVFDTGTYSSLTTEDLFMKKMKELSVILVHKSIYLMNLWKMRQQSDELIRAFAVRVTSAADLCNMVIKCLDTNCQNSLSDKVPYNYSVRHHLWGGVAPPLFFHMGGGKLIDYCSGGQVMLWLLNSCLT